MSKIHVYVLCYNEMKLAPFAVQYWKQYADKVYVYDNGSNDGTIEYLSRFPELIEIRHYDSAGVDDIKYLEIKNNVWKESNGAADWVVVGDFDECVYFKDISILELCKNNGITIIKPVWCNCISDSFPEYSDEFVHNKIRYTEGGSKCMIFNPNEITEINFYPGCHQCSPIGNVKIAEFKDCVYCFHLVNMGLDFLIDKTHKRRERMCENNIKRGFGVQYLFDDETVTKNFNDDFSKSKQITIQ